MKKQLLLLVLMVAFAAVCNAQRIVVLHSATGVSAFSGASPFVDAYNAAQPGDTLYLSGGSFALPDTVNKRLSIFGAGYHPNFTPATNLTQLEGNLVLGPNADSLFIEGVMFVGNIHKTHNESVNSITIRRSRINGDINFGGNARNSANMVVAESILIGTVYLTGITNSIFTNSIFQSYVDNSISNVFNNNIFLHSSWASWTNQNDIISNSIILGSHPGSGSHNLVFRNSIFTHSSPVLGGSPSSENNRFGIPLADIFQSHTGNVFSHDSDFRLKTPADFIGLDGSQIGLFGGLFPFKAGGVPVTPHISQKNIAGQTTPDGRLNISVTVAAQDR